MFESKFQANPMKRFIEAVNAVTFTMVTIASLLVAAPSYAAPVLGQGTWQSTLQARDLDGNGVVDAFYDSALDLTWLRNANVNGAKSFDAARAWALNLSFGGLDDWRLPTMIDTGTSYCNFSYGGTDCGYNVQTSSEMAHLLYVTLGNKPQYNSSGVAQSSFGLSNTANFQNLVSGDYWIDQFGGAKGDVKTVITQPPLVESCTISLYYRNCSYYLPPPTLTNVTTFTYQHFALSTANLEQKVSPDSSTFYAMAVRKGDRFLNDPDQIQLIPSNDDSSPFPAPTAAIPEPETYAMMLAGLGLIGAVSRRRKAKLAA